jgi:D-alanyl-D-alanine carboxypeptidase
MKKDILKRVLINIGIFILITIIILVFPHKLSNSQIGDKQENKVDDKEQVFEIKEPLETTPEKKTNGTDTKPSTETDNWWKYPDTIYETTRNGNDLFVLVNKQYKLSSSYAPSDLVLASNSGIRRGSSYYLRNTVIPDLTEMARAAISDNIDLSVVSAYRSYQTQVSTYNYWLSKNNNNVEYVDTFSARPGHSQHQLGTVIDFSTNEINDVLGDSFANTKASTWLIENAYKYGWVISYPKEYESITGYKYESWHYRYIGKSNALEMKNNGMILETYLKTKN